MRKLCMIVVLLGVLQSSCNRAVNKPALYLKGEEGYVTAREGLQFLLAIQAIDSAKAAVNLRGNSATDTIGRFFPSNFAGNKIVLFIIPQDDHRDMLLFELNKAGEVVNKSDLNMNNSWCWQDAIRTFTKQGRYFMVEGCGHGSDYQSSYLYIFDGIDSSSSGVVIFQEASKNIYPHQSFTSDIKFQDSSILMDYTFEQGVYNDKIDDFTMEPPVRQLVVFKKQGKTWAATDSTLLKKMELYE